MLVWVALAQSTDFIQYGVEWYFDGMVVPAAAIAEAACCSPAETSTAPAEAPDDVRLALMAKALGHPVRIRILRLLLERQACVTGEMVAELPLAQSTVSEHLRVLRAAGLIQGEIEGPHTSYCVSADGLVALRAGIASL
jgi:ArsR family transcriptional regulator